MLHESLLLYQIKKLFLGHKVVLLAILFGSPGATRCVRYAETKFTWEIVKEALEDGGFAGARGTRDHNGLVGGEGVSGNGDRVDRRHGGGVVGEGAERRCVVDVFGMEIRQGGVSQA